MKGAKSLQLSWAKQQEPVFPPSPQHTHTRKQAGSGFIVALCCGHIQGSRLPKHWGRGGKRSLGIY